MWGVVNRELLLLPSITVDCGAKRPCHRHKNCGCVSRFLQPSGKHRDDPPQSPRAACKALPLLRVLNESRAAVLRNCPQPSGPVAVATTQHNTHDPPPMGFGGGDE